MHLYKTSNEYGQPIYTSFWGGYMAVQHPSTHKWMLSSNGSKLGACDSLAEAVFLASKHETVTAHKRYPKGVHFRIHIAQ